MRTDVTYSNGMVRPIYHEEKDDVAAMVNAAIADDWAVVIVPTGGEEGGEGKTYGVKLRLQDPEGRIVQAIRATPNPGPGRGKGQS